MESDVIYRQDTIDAINTWDKFGIDERSRVVRWREGLEPYVKLRDVVLAIAKLPSAEPKRKVGKWIPVMNGRGGHCCNRCNGYAPSYMNGDEHLSDFCPNCGAKMELVLNIM